MLRDNVTFALDHDTLMSDDIFKFWSYSHNLGIIALKKLDIIDRFGRMRVTPEEAITTIQMEGADDDPYKAFGFLINTLPSVESWVKFYPEVLWSLPHRAIINRLMKNDVGEIFEFLGSNDVVCAFPVAEICGDKFSACLFYDSRIFRYCLEFRLVNMYGNSCKLLFTSNTDRMFEYMENIRDLDNLTVIIQPCPRGIKTSRSKILCSMIEKGESA